METPAACPVKKSIGDECRVFDTNFKYQYDLSPLVAQGLVYTVQYPHTLGKFRLSICEPFDDAKTLCGDEMAGACLFAENGQNISLGKASSMLQYDTGILTLVYKDGAPGCGAHGENRTTTIHFLCDHSASLGTSLPNFGSMDENCGFVFHWFTELACPPREEVQCSVETPDGVVDLSKLSNPRGNYFVHDSIAAENVKYVINICRSIIPKKSVTCEFSSGACSISGNTTLSLGVASKPTYNAEESEFSSSLDRRLLDIVDELMDNRWIDV